MTMGIPDKTTRDLVQQLWSQVAGHGLTPLQAKLYSNHVLLGLGRPGVAAYSAADTAARLREAELLLESAGLLRSSDPTSAWRKPAKRAGELLEWLANDEVNTDGLPAIVLAAAAYLLLPYTDHPKSA